MSGRVMNVRDRDRGRDCATSVRVRGRGTIVRVHACPWPSWNLCVSAREKTARVIDLQKEVQKC